MARKPISTRTNRLVQRRLGRESGLTLVEMLVAMVILGFVMALVSEVVFQVSQVARAADAVTRGSTARWGQGWSAGSLFANLLAPEETGDDPALTGTTRSITGYSSLPLDGSNIGVAKFELELRTTDGSDSTSTELISIAGANSSAFAKGSVVALFPGRAEFAFVDIAGRTQLSWPALTRSEQDFESLPQAVMVRDAQSGKMLMWYGFQGEIIKPKSATSPFGGLTQ